MNLKDKFWRFSAARVNETADFFRNKKIKPVAERLDRAVRSLAKKTELSAESDTPEHEAGHAFLQNWFFPERPTTKLSCVWKRGSNGTQYADPNYINETLDEIVRDIAVKYGGYYAEKILSGDTTDSVSEDTAMAADSAQSAVRKYFMTQEPVLAQEGKSDSKTWYLFGKPVWSSATYRSSSFSEAQKQRYEELEKQVLTEGQALAYMLISRHAEKVQALANALRKERILHQREVAEILDLD